MAYQLHHYSTGRTFEYTDRFDAPDDQAALVKALGKASAHDMELWCGHRRILVLERSPAIAAADP